MKWIKTYLTVFLVTAFFPAIKSQNISYSAWESIFLGYNINSKTSLHNEIHIRPAKFVAVKKQYAIRPFISYKIYPNLTLSGGYTYLKNYEESYSFVDQNVWEEVKFNMAIEKSKFEQRFRFEQRFTEIHESPKTQFSTRLRYRLQWAYPLFKINKKPLNITLNDELWISTGQGIIPHSFASNWFYSGVNYPFTKNFKLGVGYRYINSPEENSDPFENHILQTELFFAFP